MIKALQFNNYKLLDIGENRTFNKRINALLS
jgi:hypothetical protein